MLNIVPVCSICGENVDMEKDTLGRWFCTTCHLDTIWEQRESGSYLLSSHYCLLRDKVPKYHLLANPDGDCWVIGVFYPFIGGEYVPLEEDGEERLVFSTAEEEMNHVDGELEKD